MGTLPGRFPGRLGRASTLLFHYEPDGTLVAPTGQALTFTRASVGGGLADTLGYVRQTIHSQPKFEAVDLDGDGVRETVGLLLEQQRTNAMQFSEQFDNAYWAKTASTITADATRAPDGTLTADKLAEDNTTNLHRVEKATGTLTDNTYQSLSVFARQGERSWLWMRLLRKNGVTAYAWFDLANGVVGTVGDAANSRARIERYADGWYRCLFAADCLSGGTSPTWGFGTATGDAVNSFTGTTGSGVYVWGAQLEIDKAFPTTYIPTPGAATVQRNVDALTFTPAWRMQDVTLYARIARAWWMDISGSLGGSTQHCFVCHLEPTVGTAIRLYFDSSTRTALGQLDTGAAAVQPSLSIPAGSVVELCLQGADLATAPRARLDVGSGFGAWSSPLVEVMPDGWTANGSYVGGDSTSERRLHAPLLAFKVASGARTLAEMRGLV